MEYLELLKTIIALAGLGVLVIGSRRLKLQLRQMLG